MAIPNHVAALANHKGAAIVHAGGMIIPVKILDIESEGNTHDSTTVFKALVLSPDSVSTADVVQAARTAKTAANSLYGSPCFKRDGVYPSNRYATTEAQPTDRRWLTSMTPEAVKKIMDVVCAPQNLTGLFDPEKNDISYEIDHVDFDATSTSVFWKDGTQTDIVYQAGDPEFKEQDLATAFTLKCMGAKRVIFNNPMTIVLWTDGTKTIVKCQEGDTYSHSTGLSTCFAKKTLGNKGNFNDVFKKHIPNY